MLVIILRVLIPFLILKFPFIGGLLSAGLDHFDLNLTSAFGEEIQNYQKVDKILDFFYLSLEAIVALSWVNIRVKRAALGLFLYRSLGILLFEITNTRAFLFFFPNFFEFFFLLYLFFQGISGKDYLVTKKDKIFFFLSLLFFFSFKLYQEYSLHILDQHPWPGFDILSLLWLF